MEAEAAASDGEGGFISPPVSSNWTLHLYSAVKSDIDVEICAGRCVAAGKDMAEMDVKRFIENEAKVWKHRNI